MQGRSETQLKSYGGGQRWAPSAGEFCTCLTPVLPLMLVSTASLQALMNVELVEMIEDGTECPACLHIIHLFGKLLEEEDH